jgi:Pyruvate/2-oxoacid:ferredoxin oxidoreductase gamma subunit
VVEVDATNIAAGIGNLKVQNMVMLAGLLKATSIITLEEVKTTLEQTLGVKNPKLVPLNLQAIKEGLATLS